MLFNAQNTMLSLTAFSDQPFSFTSPEVHSDLATILEINLIENGNRLAREHWQKTQLINLLNFSYSQSNFWKKRIPQNLPQKNPLEKIPILTREDIAYQTTTEGSLTKTFIPTNHQTYASSGSTSTPVKVHVCPQNARYNTIRSHAQYFIEGRKLNEPRTFIKPADGSQMLNPGKGIQVENFNSWLGNLSHTFNNGPYKIIHLADNPEALIEELLRDRVGYLACTSSHMDILLRKGGLDLIKKLGIHMWLHHSDNRDKHQLEALNSIRIPVKSTYSCSETGPIAVECSTLADYYHVAHSNVIVEIDLQSTVKVEGVTLGRVLLTHLHSYATPLIRYDVGDFAMMHPSCPCGHDGPTLSNIYGRRKYFLTNADGTFLPFAIFSKPLLDITTFTDFFVYQCEINTIIIELGGRTSITLQEEKNIQNFIQRLSSPSFKVIVKPVSKIDWSKNPKRLPFVNKVPFKTKFEYNSTIPANL